MQAFTIRHISRDVQAALKLGDVCYLSKNLHWVRDLHANSRMPPNIVNEFLLIYCRAVEEVLGSRGTSVINWIGSKMDKASLQ